MAVKQHKKHQVVDTYFSAKVEEMQEREKWAQARQEGVGLLDGDQIVQRVMQALSQSKEQEHQMLESLMNKYSEYDNISHMIQQDGGAGRKKFKMCLTC